MSFTCQQCGNVSDQLLNFCRKCGAPAPTVTLATAPLSAIGAQATQEMGQVVTDALRTNPPTRKIAEVDPPHDPLDTWEPTKAVAAPAATEVLPSAPVAAPAPQPTPQPTQAVADARKPVVATATTAPKSNKGILIAATVAVLLVLAGGGWFLMNRRSTPPSDAPALIVNDSLAETNTAAAPLPSLAADAPATAITASSPVPNAAVNAKPVASVKAESKTNATALPLPDPYAAPNAATKATAPEPVKPEPEKIVPAESPAGNNASWMEQGNRLASAGQFQEAIQMYEKARRANPGNADVYYLIGSAYHRSGDLANALEAYRKCTSGNYASVAANHVKNLGKKLSKAK